MGSVGQVESRTRSSQGERSLISMQHQSAQLHCGRSIENLRHARPASVVAEHQASGCQENKEGASDGIPNHGDGRMKLMEYSANKRTGWQQMMGSRAARQREEGGQGEQRLCFLSKSDRSLSKSAVLTNRARMLISQFSW